MEFAALWSATPLKATAHSRAADQLWKEEAVRQPALTCSLWAVGGKLTEPLHQISQADWDQLTWKLLVADHLNSTDDLYRNSPPAAWAIMCLCPVFWCTPSWFPGAGFPSYHEAELGVYLLYSISGKDLGVQLLFEAIRLLLSVPEWTCHACVNHSESETTESEAHLTRHYEHARNGLPECQYQSTYVKGGNKWGLKRDQLRQASGQLSESWELWN